jgi:hypothetical protein
LVIFELWSAVLQPQVIPYSELQYFSTLSLNRNDFTKKHFLVTKCVFWVSVQTFSETFFIIRKVEREWIKDILEFSCQTAIFIVRFTRKLSFLVRCSNIFKYQVSWNSVHSYKNGRTDVTKLIVASRKLTQLIRSHFSSFLTKCDVTNTAVVCIECIKVFRVFICISVISFSPFC